MDGEDVPLPEDGVVEPGRRARSPTAAAGRARRRDRWASGAAVVPLRDPVVGEPAERPFLAVFSSRMFVITVVIVQPAHGIGEFPVVLAAGMPEELPEAVVGDEGDPGRRLPSVLDALVQMRGGEDDEVPVPDAGEAELGRGMDAERDIIPDVPIGRVRFFWSERKGYSIASRLSRHGGSAAVTRKSSSWTTLPMGRGAYRRSAGDTRCGDNRYQPLWTDSGYREPAGSGYREPKLGVSRTENRESAADFKGLRRLKR